MSASHFVYRLHSQIVIENFEDGALALRLYDRHLFDLNPTAQFILNQTDGAKTVAQIAASMALTFGISHDEALADVSTLYASLVDQHVVSQCDPLQNNQEGGMMNEAQYVRNPDVGLREEDENGGLLFNPDTNQMQVVNTTGLFIWRLCDGSRTLANIVSAMLEEFEGATEEEMCADATAFIEQMTAAGFIGTVEPITAEGAASDG